MRTFCSILGRTLAFLALLPVWASVAAGQSMTLTAGNVKYGPHWLETMDVYIPPTAGPSRPVPAVIEIHAGGWTGGTKSFFALYGGLIEQLHARGIAIVSINYPLAPQDLFPAAAHSCQRAVQFVRSKASQWFIDPARIGVLGCSSGAHLAMWVAVAPDAKVAGSSDPILSQSSHVNACIAYTGPSDLTDQYYKNETASYAMSPVWQFVGVQTQAEWDALPQATKDYLSPRKLALDPGNAAVNAEVRFLGIFPGSQMVWSQSQLNFPTGDIHHLVHGLAFRDALLAIGSPEAIVWSSYSTYDSVKGLLAAEFAADWMALQLTGAKVRTIPGGTPGCISQQYLTASNGARVGGPPVKLRSHDGFPNSLALVALATSRLPVPTDYFYAGVNLIVDPASAELYGGDAMIDGEGRVEVTIPVPNDPTLKGKVYYAQVFSAWTYQLGTFPYCKPSPLGLVSTPALEITVE